jgi:LemA protein
VVLEVCGLFTVGMLAVAAVIIGLPVFFVVLAYNSFISRRNQIKNTFATIDVMLKKRYDLIPNLVSTVQGYMTHERGVFEEITKLRSKAITGDLSDNDKIDVNNQISGALKTIFASVENYPDLKANKNFLHLQASMTELEEQISAARRAYNASVLSFNNMCDMFPTSIMASIMGFKRYDFFQASDPERAKPTVAFGDRR